LECAKLAEFDEFGWYQPIAALLRFKELPRIRQHE